MKDSTMRQTELMLRIVLLISIVVGVFAPFGSIHIAKLISNSDITQMSYNQIILVLLRYLGHAGVAVWLYVLAKQYGAYRRLWALFGLFFGVYAVIVFYLVRIHDMIESQLETAET
jgi:hypothetical protein